MKMQLFISHLVIMELVILLCCATSCSAKNREERKSCMPMGRSELLLRTVVGDSVAGIILKARNVEIGTDSCPAKRLNVYEKAIVQYLIADTCNFESDTKVYGLFHSCLSIKFKCRRKNVIIHYDFNLHKWTMENEDKQLLCRYDLKSDEIVRFALLALPDDDYLNKLYKQKSK